MDYKSLMALRLTYEELLSFFESSCVPEDDRLVGLEWEKELVTTEGKRLSFEGEHGIEALLKGLANKHGWAEQFEKDRVVALTRGGESITLEPGAQVEYSTPPRRRLVDIEIDIRRHLGEVQHITDDWNTLVLETGFTPVQDCEDIVVVPKERYQIMDEYLRPRGQLAHAMMRGSTSVQVSFDYQSPGDAAQKLQVALSLSPIITALLANSPLAQGAPNGVLSYRTHCWRHTDPERTGLLAGLREGRYSFESYLDWALSVPMMFMRREGSTIPARGLTFKQWMTQGADGCWPDLSDFELHLTALFPEVRLKNFIELRGADNGSVGNIMATAALWKGLLYDRFALGDAREIADELQAQESGDEGALLDIALREGLNGHFAGRKLQVWAAELVDIAAEGLMHQSPDGPAEVAYLAPLQELVDSGLSPAHNVLSQWSEQESTAEALKTISYPLLAEITATSPEAGALSLEFAGESSQREESQ